MGKHYNSEGIEMDSDFTIPDGEYVLEVTNTKEGESKNGDYQVVVDFKVCEGERKGFQVRYYYVTFFADKKAKGAGMAINFLKSIGEPWEGDFTIEPDNWKTKRVNSWLEAQEYNGRKNMKVKWVKPVEADQLESVPF